MANPDGQNSANIRGRSQMRVLNAVSIEDAGHEMDDISPLQRVYIGICFVVSSMFGALYLGTLMMCAIFTDINQPSSNTASQHHDNWNRRSSAGPNSFRGPVLPTLSKQEAVLKLDLRYYVKLQGYEIEEFLVTTQDGFNIEIQHIVVPGESHAEFKRRYPVLMLHGLLQSSAAYCTSGENSLAFFLVKNGYDVWLGNNRCGFHPSHVKLGSMNLGMWSWRIQELGTLDVPCLVDFVRSKRGVDKIAFVAHSQGTAQTFLALAKDSLPELGTKLSSFCALSPAVYTGPLVGRWFLSFLRHFSLPVYRLFFGYLSYMPLMMIMPKVMSTRLYSHLGYSMFRYMFQWNDKLWDPRYRDRQLLFSPVYVSAELMYWWLGKGGFASRGCLFNHESPDHPWFDSRFPPLQLVVPGADNMVDPYKLINRMKQVEKFIQHVEVTEISEYSHLDVLWATDVIHKVGVPMLKFIRQTLPEGEWLSLEDFD